MTHTNINGAELFHELQGSGEPFVCIHGLQGDATNFATLAAALGRDFTVLTFDQRGSGRSEKPDEPYSLQQLADDTAALIEAVGFDSAFVFGVSMGGMIAQELALRHPEKVRRLVLGCTTAGGHHAIPPSRDTMDYVYTKEPLSAEERTRRFTECCFTAPWLSAHPEVVERLLEARRQLPLDPDALARRREALSAHDTWDRLPSIRQPTLVITGKPDRIIPEANSRLLADRLPNAELLELEPSGHLFWIERERDTLEALRRFLL
ncbi:MAG: alpha/beta hydrolase [Arenicellales bacterium]